MFSRLNCELSSRANDNSTDRTEVRNDRTA
nr:MAG TPA: hypothetical protein [Caudoviricetes sp.]